MMRNRKVLFAHSLLRKMLTGLLIFTGCIAVTAVGILEAKSLEDNFLNFQNRLKSTNDFAAIVRKADGPADLAQTGYDIEGSIRLLKNLGGFKFAETLVRTSEPGWPTQVSTADIDNDGNDELFVVIYRENNPQQLLEILSAEGDTYVTIKQIELESYPEIKFGDLNADGYIDLILSDYDRFSVYFNQPESPEHFLFPLVHPNKSILAVGKFTDPKYDSLIVKSAYLPINPVDGIEITRFFQIMDLTSISPIQFWIPLDEFGEITVADLNKDGLSDLIQVYNDPNDWQIVRLRLYLSQDVGQYKQKLLELPPEYYYPRIAAMNLAEFDQPVIIISEYYNQGYSHAKLAGDDGSYSGEWLPFYATPVVHSMTAGDLNGDGSDDLMLISACDPQEGINIYSRQQSPACEGHFCYAGRVNSENDLAAVVNSANGLPDLIQASWYSGSLKLLENQGDFTFKERSIQLSQPGYAWQVATGDLNNDGEDDLAVSLWNSMTYESSVEILVKDSFGGYSTTSVIPYAAWGPVFIADVNNDGLKDLSFNSEMGVLIFVNRPDQPGYFNTDRPGGLHVNYIEIAAVGNFTSKEYPVYLFKIYYEGYIFHAVLDVVNYQVTYPTEIDPYVQEIFTADLNGDGYTDLVQQKVDWSLPTGPDTKLSLLYSDGDGMFAESILKVPASDSPWADWSRITTVKMCGAKAPALVIAGYYNDGLTYFKLPGDDGNFSGEWLSFKANSVIHSMTSADLDQDGREDIVQISSAEQAGISFYQNNFVCQ
jgi:hypothetical protein